MHCESFPVNSVFCAQLQKFSPSKVLPYTVYFLGSNDIFGCYLICLTVLLEVFSTIVVVKNAIIVLLKKCIILLTILNLPVFSAAKYMYSIFLY